MQVHEELRQSMADGASTPRVFVNVHGDLSRAEDAVVPALDHGFLYGDSVYETVRTFGGVPFLLDRHLERLDRSLARILLPSPLSRSELEREIARTIAEVPFDEVVLRIVISRGPGPIGLDIDTCHDPRYLIYAIELVPSSVSPYASPDGPDGGVGIVLSSVRRNSPRALDPAIKSGNFLNNILAYRDARMAGANEAILCTSEGYLAEGTTSNVFLVQKGCVRTPRREGILDGVTRAVVFEEAARAGIPIEEATIAPDEFFAAEEAFITSSVRGILPVAAVNGRPVGSGRRGPVTLKLQQLYEARIEAECSAGSRQDRASR